jgi:hypothetical protein
MKSVSIFCFVFLISALATPFLANAQSCTYPTVSGNLYQVYGFVASPNDTVCWYDNRQQTANKYYTKSEINSMIVAFNDTASFTATGNTVWVVPANRWSNLIAIKPSDTTTLYIGLTDTGREILTPLKLQKNVFTTLSMPHLFSESMSTSLFFKLTNPVSVRYKIKGQ